MKKVKLFFIGFASLCLVSCLTTVQLSPKQMEVVKIVETDKDESVLFKDCNLWLTEVFSSANSVIEYTDKEEGIIRGNGIYDKNIGTATRRYRFTVQIDVKENRARIILVGRSIQILGFGPDEPRPTINEDLWTSDLRPILSNLSRDFESTISSSKSSEW